MRSTFVAVAHIDEVPPGEARVVETDYERVLLCNVDGVIYAIADVCTHDDGPLGDGTLENCAIECPRHGARFDVRTGEVVAPPAVVPVRSYAVRVREDGIVEVELDQ